MPESLFVAEYFSFHSLIPKVTNVLNYVQYGNKKLGSNQCSDHARAHRGHPRRLEGYLPNLLQPTSSVPLWNFFVNHGRNEKKTYHLMHQTMFEIRPLMRIFEFK